MFVKFACDFNSQDENGYSPLHHAVIKNNYAAVLFLLNLLSIDIYVIIISFKSSKSTTNSIFINKNHIFSYLGTFSLLYHRNLIKN